MSRERGVPAGPSDGTRFEVLGVGASTGGPTALRELFSGLPADFPLPILVVQHITAGFTAGFVEWLRQHTLSTSGSRTRRIAPCRDRS